MHARRVAILGGINLLCYGFASVASYWLVAFAPNAARPSPGSGLLADPRIWGLLAYGPLAISTGVFVVLLAAISRAADDELDDRQLRRWAFAFAAAAITATPIIVNDFWNYVAYARLIAGGHNPYFDLETAGSVLAGNPPPFGGGRGLPPLPYGPAWAVVSGTASWLANRHVILTAAVLKLTLGAAWVGSLWLVQSLTARLRVRARAVAIALFGWLPLSINLTLAEGHNDVAMLALVLLWIWCLDAARPVLASAAFALSVLTKYLSGPLVIFDFLHAWFTTRRWWSYWPSVLSGGLVTIALCAPLFRSTEALSFTTSMSAWHFFTPADAVWALEDLTAHLGLSRITRLVFPVLALVAFVRYVTARDERTFRAAIASTLAALMFGVMGHLWPWFLTTLLGVAALTPDAALTRWTLGVCLPAPFVMLPQVTMSVRTDFVAWRLPAVLMYAAALLWFAVTPRRWFGAAEPSR